MWAFCKKSDGQNYIKQLREEVQDARELLNFAISEGNKQVDDRIIRDINRMEQHLQSHHPCECQQDDSGTQPTPEKFSEKLNRFKTMISDLSLVPRVWVGIFPIVTIIFPAVLFSQDLLTYFWLSLIGIAILVAWGVDLSITIFCKKKKFNELLTDPNFACASLNKSPIDLDLRISFEKAYRDLVKHLDPVTSESLRVSAFPPLIYLLVFIIVFVFLLLMGHLFFAGWYPIRALIITLAITFFVWFLDLFTGVIRKKRVIEIVLFCYLFTLIALLLSVSPFLASILGWNFETSYSSMSSSPIGILKGCNKQVEKGWVTKELFCENTNNRWLGFYQWVFNIGGTTEPLCASSQSAGCALTIHKKAEEKATAIRLEGKPAAFLAQGDWIWIEGNSGEKATPADLVKIVGPVAAEKDVAISPPLRASHDVGREVRKALVSMIDFMGKPAEAGVTTIQVKGDPAAVLEQDDWLWIGGNPGKEEVQAELVRITEPVITQNDVTFSPP